MEEVEKPLLASRPRRQRKRTSAVKCGCILFALSAVAFVGMFIYFAATGLWEMLESVRSPHRYRSLYLNETSVLTEPAVFPIIDKDTEFDVWFTVWARKADEDIDMEREQQQMEQERERLGAMLPVIVKRAGVPEREVLSRPQEVLVHSEKLFDGVDRRARNLRKEVELSFEAKRLYDEYIYTTDFRAVLTVVPTSREPLKGLSSWSDRRPEPGVPLPRLGEETVAQLGLNNVQRDALDRMSFAYPLLGLVKPSFNHTSNATLSDDDKTERRERWGTFLPRFISRSHIFILDEMRPLNKTVYDEEHESLKKASCGLSEKLPACRWLCGGVDAANGLFASASLTVRGISSPSPSLVRNTYTSPTLHRSTLDARPHKLQFNHTIYFSSLSPARAAALNTLTPAVPLDQYEEEAIKEAAHEQWEITSGLLGNRSHDLHPWRRLVLGFIDDILIGWPLAVLGILYWYTRLTSTGIHSLTAYVGGATYIAGWAHRSYLAFAGNDVGWGLHFLILVMSTQPLLQGVLMLKCLTPLEVEWKRLKVIRVPWSKNERSTRRVERRLDQRVKIMLPILIYAFAFAVTHYDYWVIPSLRTPLDEGAVKAFMQSSWIYALDWTGHQCAQLLQLWMNIQCGTFAGRYAITAYLRLARRIIELLYFVPWVVGRVDTRGGIRAMDVVEIPLVAWTAYQAWTLPRVEQVEEEEEE